MALHGFVTCPSDGRLYQPGRGREGPWRLTFNCSAQKIERRGHRR